MNPIPGGRLVIERLAVAGPHGQELLAPLDLVLDAGRTTCLVGESGAGKSLVCAAVAGTLPPELRCSGRIWLDGVDVTAMDARARRALWSRSLFLLPQEPWAALAPSRSAAAQVGDMPRLHPCGPGGGASRLLERVGLVPSRDGPKRPAQLSGGMAQRVAMATTLGAPAGLVLVDEPTKGLDHARRWQAEDGLRSLMGQGRALLLVTHDLDLARSLGDEVVVMRDGQVLERGADVLAQPRHAFTRALMAAQPEGWPARLHRPGQAVITVDGLAIRAGTAGPMLASGVAFAIGAGGITGLSGPSGAGKTTLGDTVLGLRRPAAGQVRWAGIPRGQKLYQDPGGAFAPWRPIRATMADALAANGGRCGGLDAACGPMLARLGLSGELLERRPAAVSGGELQRLSLVRALLCRPSLIFADEPTSRLDAITQHAMARLLSDTADGGTAILLASHNEALLAKLAGTTVAL